MANKFYLLSSQGIKVEIKEYDGLSVHFSGENSEICIGEGSVFRNVSIEVGNDALVEIGKTNAQGIRNSMIRLVGNGGGKFLSFGEGASIMSSKIEILSGITNSLKVGLDAMWSEGIHIRNSDSHQIFDISSGKTINNNGITEIGNHVWLGWNVTVLKNTEIADNTIVGMESVVAGKFTEENVAIAGNPARIVKRGINWRRDYLPGQ
ncbi:acyltransferase [Lactococcus lactis]|uniref:acyltransferase n=2 Tax=Lactococcus lactis TaxID=1358 RepID=UPI00068FA7DE|nr:hypothetical protein [Lactococcus lactis]